jgi:hypothetical protein
MPATDNVPFLQGVLRCFTRIDLPNDAGLVARRGVVPEARLTRIRRTYLLEAVIFFVITLSVVWCEYWLDKSGTKVFRMVVGVPAILWMFVLSPIVHSRTDGAIFLQPHQQWNALGWYFWEFRGLGNPLRYYVGADGQPPLIIKHWRCVAAVMAAMTLLYISAAFNFSKEIDERYASHYATFGGKFGFILFLLCVIDLGWLFIGIPFMVRLDNFANSVRFIAAFLIGVLVFVVLFNLFFQFVLEPFRAPLENWHYIRLRGEPSSERLHTLLQPLKIGGQWSGYVTWGWVQQFIFASYFGVLFGRAFPVDRSRADLMKAVLCTSACFSLIHLPNVWLMVFTFTGGIFGTILFYQMFNLFAIGFSHGFGGSLLNQLTPINFSVGAGQMRGR